MPETYYKILNADGTSPTTNFDYSPYLPKGGAPGKWLPRIDGAKIRERGYYASKYWNMWYAKGRRIFEVELADKFAPADAGAEHQICSSRMRLLKDVTDEILSEYRRKEESAAVEIPKKEKWNIGPDNSGMGNVGAMNSGNFNLGNSNSGKRNRGSFNTGDANAGMDNVGDRNSGSSNSGSENVGHRNSGDSNEGSYNSGSHNRGHKNSGSFNVGNSNSGNWNVGDRHCGFFNTKPAPVYMFNKPAGLPPSKISIPAWLNKPDPKSEFEKAPESELLAALSLPNFDHEIFEEITGISKSDFDRRLRRTR